VCVVLVCGWVGVCLCVCGCVCVGVGGGCNESGMCGRLD